MGGRIFISYRRGEDTASAGRLYDRLNRTFRRRLFMDVDSIPPGEDFIAILEREVAACDVLLALIGRGWLSAVDEAGRRRLDNAADFVRIEVGAALAQRKRVIPVLIEMVAMPRPDELPDDLKPLARRNAVRISHERFESDVQRLIKALRPIVGPTKPADVRSVAPSAGAGAPPSPASGRGEERPLPEGEVGAPAPGEKTTEVQHSGADLDAILTAPAAPSPRPSPASGRGGNDPLPPGEVGANAPGEGSATAPSLSRGRERVGVRATAAPKQKNGVFIGADFRDLPDFAVFKDIDAPWCPEMVVLPAETFLMGSPLSESGRLEWEGPQHGVTISRRFAIGRYAVTFDEYDHFCEVTTRAKPADAGWGRGRRPVIHVSWQDAQVYLEWLNSETGHAYRLPSEAEWEYACRAGTTVPFSFGETITTDQVNYDGRYPYDRVKGTYRGQTVPVGSLPANPWGLHEMHGNVWEWCHDGPRNYTGSSVTDPLGSTEPGSLPVLRGGSWIDGARNVRSACRRRYDPGDRSVIFGFRCARVQEP